jgi:hypothetical protein
MVLVIRKWTSCLKSVYYCATLWLTITIQVDYTEYCMMDADAFSKRQDFCTLTESLYIIYVKVRHLL